MFATKWCYVWQMTFYVEGSCDEKVPSLGSAGCWKGVRMRAVASPMCSAWWRTFCRFYSAEICLGCLGEAITPWWTVLMTWLCWAISWFANGEKAFDQVGSPRTAALYRFLIQKIYCKMMGETSRPCFTVPFRPPAPLPKLGKKTNENDDSDGNHIPNAGVQLSI